MRIQRPSASLLVSSLALAISMTGAGYASGLISSGQIADEAVTSAKIKDRTIKLTDLSGKALKGLGGQQGPAGVDGYDGMDGFEGPPGMDGLEGPPGLDGVDGSDGADGPPGPAGPAGARGPAGSARAYALVDRVLPTLVVARSSGFARVTRPAVGVYCLTLSDNTINPSTLAPLAAVEVDSSTAVSATAHVSLNPSNCPLGSDVAVKTFAWTSTAEAVASNGVSFTVLVP